MAATSVIALHWRRESSTLGLFFFGFNNNNNNTCSSSSFLFKSKSKSPLVCSPLHFSTSTASIQPHPADNIPHQFQFLIHKYNFSPKTALKIASISSRRIRPQNCDSVLSFLKDYGLSNAQLERAAREPVLLCASVEKTIKPSIIILQDLGFSADEIAAIVVKNPRFMCYNMVSRHLASISALKGLLGTDIQVARLIRKLSACGYSAPENLVHNVEFLKSFGVPVNRILIHIYSSTRFLLAGSERFRKCVHKADEMSVDRTSKAFIFAARTVSLMSEKYWKLKLKNFQDLDFSEDDIMRVFRSEPQVFAGSIQKIKKVKEVLLETGKYDMSSIVGCPNSLTQSVEKRFKPRLRVLDVLEKKNLIKKWPMLPTLSTMTNDKFFEKYAAHRMSKEGKAVIGKREM